MQRQLLPAIRILLVLTMVTGLAYPLAVTAVAQLVFPHQANSSQVVRDGVVVGSELQGQVFDVDEYFHGRPSAAGDGYEGDATGGSNLGPSNPRLLELVEQRAADYRVRNGLAGDAMVPVDAVTASGSGLDPDISVANARIQVDRVAVARGLPADQVRQLVEQHTAGRTLGFLGEPRVNVLALNLALDGLDPETG